MGLFNDIGDALFGDTNQVDSSDPSAEELALRGRAAEFGQYYADLVQGDEGRELSPGSAETTGLLRERFDALLRGEDDTNVALEQDLEKERERIESELSARLGPNWRQSTAGIQTMRQFAQLANNVRDTSRRESIGLQGGLLQNREGLDLNTFATKRSVQASVPGMLTNLQQPYQFDRGLNTNVDMFNTGIQQANQSGALQFLGTGAGLLAGRFLGGGSGPPQTSGGGVNPGPSGTTMLSNARWGPR